MKNYKILNKINVIILIVGLLFTASCDTDNLHDLDIPIVGIDDTKLDQGHMFANAVLASASSTGGFNTIQLPSAYVQFFATYSVILPGDRYVYEGSNDGAWGAYTNQIKHLVHLYELLKEDPEQSNNLAMVRIMKAYTFHIVTDTYGDVPYSEAGQAFFQGDFFPSYDSQQAIYTDLLKELDEAAKSFVSGQESFGSNDILFQGDIERWQKFAYSLMLRLAMRVSNVDTEMASTYITKAVEGGVLSDNSENVFLYHTDGPANINRNSKSRGIIDSDGEKYIKLGQTFIDWLVETNDPRMMIYAGGVLHEDVTDFSSDDLNTFWFDDSKWNWDPAVQKGHPHGTTIVTIASDYGIHSYEQMLKTYTRINPLLVQYNSPQVLINNAEIKLLLAEASLRGIYGGNAQQLYNEGVEAAMTQYGLYDGSLVVSEADVQEYLNSHPFDPAVGQKMIGEQLWLALFQNGQEAWSNWRRTGYPALNSVIPGLNIPVRNQYVQSEIAQNTDNYNSAVSKQGADTFDTNIWWDK